MNLIPTQSFDGLAFATRFQRISQRVVGSLRRNAASIVTTMLIAIGSSLVTATVLSWWGNFEPQGAETAARPAFESELEPADDELELPVVTEVEPQPEPVDHSFAITHAIAGERIGSALTVAYGRQARPERPPEPSPPNGPPQGLFGSVVIDR